MTLTLPQFATIKSECRTCIGTKMCPEHQKMWNKITSKQSNNNNTK